MKRIGRILLLLAILAAAGAFWLCDKTTVTGLFMLFQQNSTQSIMGRIHKAAMPGLETLFLAAFQAFAMPWKTNPRIVVAAAAIFGFVPGLLLCLAGRLLAVLLWYLLGWLILGLKGKRGAAPALAYGGLSCFLSSWAAPLALVCGGISVKLRWLLPLALLVQIPALGFPATFASVYSSLLPGWCSPVQYALGAALLVLAALALVFRLRKRKQQ